MALSSITLTELRSNIIARLEEQSIKNLPFSVIDMWLNTSCNTIASQIPEDDNKYYLKYATFQTVLLNGSAVATIGNRMKIVSVENNRGTVRITQDASEFATFSWNAMYDEVYLALQATDQIMVRPYLTGSLGVFYLDYPTKMTDNDSLCDVPEKYHELILRNVEVLALYRRKRFEEARKLEEELGRDLQRLSGVTNDNQRT